MKYLETACGAKLRTGVKVIATFGMIVCVIGFGLSVHSSMFLCPVVKENTTTDQGTSEGEEATTQEIMVITELTKTDTATEAGLETAIANATVDDPVAIPSNVTEEEQEDGEDSILEDDQYMEDNDGREKRDKLRPRSTTGQEEPDSPNDNSNKTVVEDFEDFPSQVDTTVTPITLSSTSKTAVTTSSSTDGSSSTFIASTESSTTKAPEVPKTTLSSSFTAGSVTTSGIKTSTEDVPISPSTTEAGPTDVTSASPETTETIITEVTPEATTPVTPTTPGPNDGGVKNEEEECNENDIGWVIAVVGIVVCLGGFASNITLLHSARKSKPSLAVVWLVWAAVLFCLYMALIVNNGLMSKPIYIVLHVILLVFTGCCSFIVLSFRKKLLSGHNLTFSQDLKMSKLKDDAYHELKMEDGVSYGSGDNDTKV